MQPSASAGFSPTLNRFPSGRDQRISECGHQVCDAMRLSPPGMRDYCTNATQGRSERGVADGACLSTPSGE